MGRFLSHLNSDFIPNCFFHHSYRRSMLSIVCTLIAVAALGLLFSGLRLFALAAVAILTLQFPILSLAALAVGLVVFVFIKFFK